MDANTEDPEVVEKGVAGGLDDFEKGGHQRCSQHYHQRLALEHVGDPQLDRGLVEAEFLFEDEGAVVRGRKSKDGCGEVEGEDEDEGVRDLAREACRRPSRQPKARDGPELGQKIVDDDYCVFGQRQDVGDSAKLGLCAAICLALVKRFLADFVF